MNPHCLLYPNSELIIHFLCQHRPMRGCPIINCCGTVPGNLFTQSESPFPPLSIINFCSDTYLLGRLTNFVGILSQGLRIAPPEAPVTGYMFGKGCKRSSFPPPQSINRTFLTHKYDSKCILPIWLPRAPTIATQARAIRWALCCSRELRWGRPTTA